jgi:hypothetical protein
VPRPLQSPHRPNSNSHFFPSQFALASAARAGSNQPVSRITALTIEFVAKPNEAHRVQTALPAALHGAFGEVAGFAGGFVLIANYEARLVTVVTLWSGEDRLQHCSDNLKWIRALLNPYLDRCLRIQTLAAFVPEMKALQEESLTASDELQRAEDEVVATYAA